MNCLLPSKKQTQEANNEKTPDYGCLWFWAGIQHGLKIDP